jgi:hypothetical protein
MMTVIFCISSYKTEDEICMCELDEDCSCSGIYSLKCGFPVLTMTVSLGMHPALEHIYSVPLCRWAEAIKVNPDDK